MAIKDIRYQLMLAKMIIEDSLEALEEYRVIEASLGSMRELVEKGELPMKRGPSITIDEAAFTKSIKPHGVVPLSKREEVDI